MRGAGVFALACVALAACRTPPPSPIAGRTSAPSVSAAPQEVLDAGEAGDAGGGGDGGDAGGGRSREELLGIFLEAARTNLDRPWPEGQRGSRVRYRDAAAALLGLDRFNHWRRAESHVARVLAKVDDDRAHRALVAWAANPMARKYLPEILPRMTEHARAEYLATAEAVLADPEAAEVTSLSFENPAGLLGEALEMFVSMSTHGQALGLALSLPGSAGPDLVRRYAMDRKRSVPDPRTLRALTCPSGQVRVEMEAQAVASLRILALSMLRDRALLTVVAGDAAEPPLVRDWSRRMLEGPRDRRVDPRARHNYEMAMIEYVGGDHVPCWIRTPHPRVPHPREDDEE